MKQTKGYVTDDGTFFESEYEATLYEAEYRLRAALAQTFPQLKQDPFFTIVLTLKREVTEYLDAHSTANATRPDVPHPDESEIGDEVEERPAPETDEHPTYLSGTEEDLASILKLPTRRPSNVPDVRSGTQPEEVPDGSAVHGTGSW